MRSTWPILVAVAFIISLPTAAVAQVTGIAGDWDLVMISPVGEHPLKATFKVDGEKLTGLVKGEMGETSLAGTVVGKDIKIVFTVPYQGADLQITLAGAIDGDSMKGTADYGGMAEGDWSGKRSTGDNASDAAGAGSAAGGKIDVTGSWAFSVETPVGTGNPEFTFKQDGESFTGHYKGVLGEADVNGTIKGSTISFSFKISAQGMEGLVTYSGVVENDSMKGKVKLGDLGEGNFSGKRRQ